MRWVGALVLFGLIMCGVNPWDSLETMCRKLRDYAIENSHPKAFLSYKKFNDSLWKGIR